MYFFCIKIFYLSSIPKLHTYPYVLSLLAFINLGSLYTCSLFKQTFLVGPLHVSYFTSNLFNSSHHRLDIIYSSIYLLISLTDTTFFCWYFVTISILQERSCILSVKSKSESEVAHLCPTLCDPVDCSPPGSSVHGILQARIPEWVAIPSPGDLPDPGIKPRSPALQADALTSEPSLNSFWFSWIVIDSQERAFRIIESVNSIHLVSAKAIKTYKTLAICTCALIARPSVVVIYCLNFCQSDGNYLILYC